VPAILTRRVSLIASLQLTMVV